MPQEILERYSKLIDENDIAWILAEFPEVFEIDQAAKEEREKTEKTLRDWKEIDESVRLQTKEKVLEHLLAYHPVEGLDYVVSRLSDLLSRLVKSYLLTIYEKALKANDGSEFTRLTKKFEHAKKEYAGLLHNRYEKETDELSARLELYARKIGIDWNSDSALLYENDMLDLILSELIRGTAAGHDPEELAIKLGIPLRTATKFKRILHETRYNNLQEEYEAQRIDAPIITGSSGTIGAQSMVLRRFPEASALISSDGLREGEEPYDRYNSASRSEEIPEKVLIN